MGALRDAVAAIAVTKGPPCTVARLRLTLPKDVLADFDELLAGTTFGTVLAAAATELGYPIKSDAIQRHRRHACECSRRG